MKKPSIQRIFTEYQFDEFQTVYVDVDGCLLFWQGIKPGRVPRPGEIGFGVPSKTNDKLADALRTWRHGHEDRRLIRVSRSGYIDDAKFPPFAELWLSHYTCRDARSRFGQTAARSTRAMPQSFVDF